MTTVLDMFGGGDKLIAEKRIEAEDPPDMADLRASGTGAVGPGSMLSMMPQETAALDTPARNRRSRGSTLALPRVRTYQGDRRRTRRRPDE